MPTIEIVKQQIQNRGLNNFLSRKEIKELPRILWENEDIENIIQGAYNNGLGILVATNRRAIFVDKGIFSLKVEDFAYDKISSIQYETGILSGKLILFTSGNKAVIDHVDKSQVRNFGDWLRNKISNLSNPNAQTATYGMNGSNNNQNNSTNNSDDVISKLERLAKLKESGIITEQEFQTQKAQILNR